MIEALLLALLAIDVALHTAIVIRCFRIGFRSVGGEANSDRAAMMALTDELRAARRDRASGAVESRVQAAVERQLRSARNERHG